MRKVGLELGIPEDLVWRQPFPGPGLAVRILGDITEEKLSILKDADAIFREEIKLAGIDRDINQYFAVLTNVHSVGVMGDARTYDSLIAPSRGDYRRLYDGGLGANPVRGACKGLEPNHQRGQGSQPRSLRYYNKAPGNGGMGINS